MQLKLTPLDATNLEPFRTLLGGSEFGGCFCAVWTSHDQTWASRCEDPAQPNFDRTRRDVLQGRKAGFFVTRVGMPIGWIGAGPKTEFPSLREKLGSRLSAFCDSTWAIGCIAIKQEFQGKGMATEIVRALIEHARTSGATIIEAYPTRPPDEARRYRGGCSLYERLGFEVTSAEADGESEILLMQLTLVNSRLDDSRPEREPRA